MHGNYQNRLARAKEEVAAAVAETAVTNDPVMETLQTVEAAEPEKKDLIGIVAGCTSLNVRTMPNVTSAIAAILSAGSEVMIDTAHSTTDFYKVCNAAGIEGYCMKQYITVRS